MKQGIFYSGMLAVLFFLPTSIYTIEIKKINGSKLSISAFAGKKILIMSFNAANPDAGRLLYLDSLQNTDTSLQVIGIPATDFGGSGILNNLSILNNSLSPKFLMTEPARIRRQAGTNQHELYKWLTHVSENGHFNEDASSVGQLFMISKGGTLYSILNNSVANNVLLGVVQQEMNQ